MAAHPKGFMLPAGLAITAFSDKAMSAVEVGGLPRCFVDIGGTRGRPGHGRPARLVEVGQPTGPGTGMCGAPSTGA